MSSQIAFPLEAQKLKWQQRIHFGCFLVLLIAEVLLLTIRFDSTPLKKSGSDWGIVFSWTPHLLRMAITMIAALVLFSGVRLWKRVCQYFESNPDKPVRWAVLLFHCGVFASFFYTSAKVFEGTFLASDFPLAWALAWWLAGLGTLASWCWAVLPASMWKTLAKEGWPGLLAGGFLGLLIVGFGFLSTELWEPLGFLTLELVHGLLSLFYAETVYSPAQFGVGTSTFAVRIGAECSGYEGIALITGFLGAFCWLFRKNLRFPQVFALFPIGIALMWCCNAIRIALLIAIGTSGSPEVALGGFHSQAGWLFFITVSLGLIAICNRLPVFSQTALENRIGPMAPATAAFLLPFLAMLATTLVAAAFTAGSETDWWYPTRILLGLWILWLFRSHYSALLTWTSPWHAAGLGVIVAGAWLLLTPSIASEDGAVAEALDQTSPAWKLSWIFIRLLGYVVVVPIAEELAFRGYLTRRLISSDFQEVAMGQFTWFSFVTTSVLFGVLHGPNWLPGIIAGMLFALALYKRRRLVDAVIAHAATNAIIAGYALSTGSWSLIS